MKDYLKEWRKFLQEQPDPTTTAPAAPTTEPAAAPPPAGEGPSQAAQQAQQQAAAAKAELIKDIQSMLSSMQKSADHPADTIAQIIVNNCNDFLTRQKDWADIAKYGRPKFRRNEVMYLNKD